MPESENGRTQSDHFQPRGFIDFIRSTDEQPTLTREAFDAAVERAGRYRPLYRSPRTIIGNEARAHGIRVTEYADPARDIYHLPDDAVIQLREQIQRIRVPQVDQEYPQTATEAFLVGPQDAIFDPEHKFWPQRCKAICEKPKTRQGIEKFYEHNPQLRGVA